MGRRFKLNINHNSEFDLDLAPLLAVMVKLVPVLLVSSAFVQMMVIETELPQVVKQAIEQQNNNPKAPQIAVEYSKKVGVKIIVTENGKEKVEVIGFSKDQTMDYPTVHAKFIELKKSYPTVFKIDFNPDSDVAYKDIVKIMDEARKSRSNDVRFPIKDLKTGQDTSTDYMFPEINFTNMMDG